MVKRHYGVRTDPYKLIHFYNDIDAWELYDLEKDPAEMHNVINDPAYSEVLADMQAELKKLQIQYNDTELCKIKTMNKTFLLSVILGVYAFR